MQSWESQRSHLTTHNLLYSALYGEKDRGLVSHGYRVVGEFLRFRDRRNDITIEPCYTIFDGESVIFFDFIEPNEISSEDIERIGDYSNIGLEAVETHLKRLDITEPSLNPNNVERFDHCAICQRSQYESYEDGDSADRDVLERLHKAGCIATVEPGNRFQLEDGDILRDQRLNSVLSDGITLPEIPPKNIYLPRSVRLESLAVAICEELVLGSDIREDGVAVSFMDVRNKFGRDIRRDKIDTVLEFLRKEGACRKSDGQYVFTKFHLNDILDIRNRLFAYTVTERMDGNAKNQASLDEF